MMDVHADEETFERRKLRCWYSGNPLICVREESVSRCGKKLPIIYQKEGEVIYIRRILIKYFQISIEMINNHMESFVPINNCHHKEYGLFG